MQLGVNLGFSPARRQFGNRSSIGGGSSSALLPRFWNFSGNSAGVIAGSWEFNFTGSITVDWGDGTSNFYATPPSSFSKTLGSSSGIKIIPTGGSITTINCSSASQFLPREGGDVDISQFPDLQEFVLSNAGLSSITGYANNSNLAYLFFSGHSGSSITLPPSLGLMTNLEQFICDFSNVTGTLPNLNGLSNLTLFNCSNNLLTGNIPNLSTNSSLVFFQCNNNNLTGSIPSLTSNPDLFTFNCYSNQLTGSIPSLSSNTFLQTFNCANQQGSTKLTGSIPSLSGLTLLEEFNCSGNQLTGSIPALTGLTSLEVFNCSINQLTGTMPAFTGLNALQYVNCATNQLTGNIQSLSGRNNLTDFLCNNNQLTGLGGTALPFSLSFFAAQNNLINDVGVNKILNLLAAAGRFGGSVNVAGTGNAAPTGQGLTDKATLISRGWTVTTN